MRARYRGGAGTLTLLLAGLLAGCAAEAQRAPADAPRELETVTHDLHPAGPTTLRVWRVSPEAQPHRMEILRARAGRLLVGQARLLRQADGSWFVQSSAGTKLVLQMTAPAGSPAQAFTEAQQTWAVRVLRQDIPTAPPGIALEGEPSLDLLLERQP